MNHSLRPEIPAVKGFGFQKNIVNECSYRIMRVFRMAASTLELRLSVPDFVSQFWRKIGGKAWKVTCEFQRTN